MSDDGVLTVTTPSGVSRSTRPPGMRRLASFLTEGAHRIDGPGSTSRAARGHGAGARTSVARCGPVTPSTRTAQPVLDPVRRPTISW